MINYQRVIPRDFFNEAKLLKCMGMLSLKILDHDIPEGIEIKIDEHGDAFRIIRLDEGALVIGNYFTYINDIEVTFKTIYNSKSNYPFFCEYENVDYQVFNERAGFTKEFIDKFKTLKK